MPSKTVWSYGASVQGLSHIARNKPCQDYHYSLDLGNGWTVAAIGDGVGSAKNSEKGSEKAVMTAVGFCAKNFPMYGNDDNMIKSMIWMAFNRALLEVYKLAQQEGQPWESYDTTLTLVVYNGVKIFYGHVGDSGMFGLTATGEYQAITRQQKDEDDRAVIPLRFGSEYWEVKSSGEEYAALLLVTDGILEKLIMPSILKQQKSPLNVYEMSRLMDPCFAKERFKNVPGGFSQNNVAAIEEQLQKLMSAENGYYTRVTQDDKTILVLISNKIVPEHKEESYYEKPNWNALERKRNINLYGRDFEEEQEKIKAEGTAANVSKDSANRSEWKTIAQEPVECVQSGRREEKLKKVLDNFSEPEKMLEENRNRIKQDSMKNQQQGIKSDGGQNDVACQRHSCESMNEKEGLEDICQKTLKAKIADAEPIMKIGEVKKYGIGFNRERK